MKGAGELAVGSISKSILKGPRGEHIELIIHGSLIAKKLEKWPQRIGIGKQGNKKTSKQVLFLNIKTAYFLKT